MYFACHGLPVKHMQLFVVALQGLATKWHVTIVNQVIMLCIMDAKTDDRINDCNES